MKDNQKKNRKSFAVKAGCTAGLAAVFGFVASGVFISTTTLATNVQNAKIQTAVVAEAENASDQNGECNACHGRDHEYNGRRSQ